MKTDRRTFLKTGAALLASVAAEEVYSESHGEGPLKDNADALLGGSVEFQVGCGA